MSIYDRPEIIGKRIDYGHCESDSVIYAYKMAVNSINEITTGIVRFTKLDKKTAQLTHEAMIKRNLELNIKSFTVDNGTEHMEHEEVTRQVGIPSSLSIPMLPGKEAQTRMPICSFVDTCPKEPTSQI